MNSHGASSANSVTTSAGIDDVIELNVGGVVYATTMTTITRHPTSHLATLVTPTPAAPRDSKGRCFVDRDGVLFRFVLDYMRNQKLVLPESYQERERLRQEAEYFRLPEMLKYIDGRGSKLQIDTAAANRHLTLPLTDDTVSPSTGPTTPSWRTSDPGYITVGYRGTFTSGGGVGLADVRFRKLWRILVSGKVSLCREVFKDALNESRDVDRGTTDRYTARFFLKHVFLEQAFDQLQEAGFQMVGSCGSGTNSSGDMKPGMDAEECKWNHYNEFVFCR